MPLTWRLKSACEFSIVIFMITVLAAVICGCTRRMRTASLKLTVTVLFDTTWMGIWTPCATSASMLFWVVNRGVDSTRPLPLRSSAFSATSRLKAPLTAPSAMPTAVVASGTPRRTAELVCSGSAQGGSLELGRARIRRALRAVQTAADRPLVRKREVGRVADVGHHATVEAPLHADG